jgi:hypothetical protein
MFWNDISEIRKEVSILKKNIVAIEHLLLVIKTKQINDNDIFKDFSEKIEDFKVDFEDEFSSISRIHGKLDILLEDKDRKRSVELAIKTLDKFEDYMKNVDKLNMLINEFKGCVSLARGSLASRKEEEALKNEYLTKIDYIWENMIIFVEFMQKQEKKPPKKPKTTRKKSVSKAPESE